MFNFVGFLVKGKIYLFVQWSEWSLKKRKTSSLECASGYDKTVVKVC